MWERFDRAFYHWFAIVLITLALIVAQPHFNWLATYPKDLIVPFADWLNAIMDWLVDYLGWLFMGVSWLLEWPIKGFDWCCRPFPGRSRDFFSALSLISPLAGGWRFSP